VFNYAYLLTAWSRILFEKLIVTQLIRKYPAFFMEPKGSSSCSQKPVTGPYPEQYLIITIINSTFLIRSFETNL